MSATATAPPPVGLVARLRATPDAVKLLVFYALTRLWAAFFIDRAAGHQLPSIWTDDKSSYFDMAQLWDGQWYKIIAEQNYPPGLPLDQAGNVQQNP